MRSGLWFVPLVYALAAVALNVVTIAIDRRNDHELLSVDAVGGPDAALAILGTVAASMVGLVGTVLAITMVVVQLAMAQFSPRIVQTFLQDRPSQHAIGLFVATFVQAMLSMREVQVSEDHPVVPGLSVAVTFALVIVVIVVLVIYIHHIGEALRVSALIELVGSNTRDLTDEVYAERLSGWDPPEDPHVVVAETSGVLTRIFHDDLVDLAADADAVIAVLPALGQFVPSGGTLARVDGRRVADLDERRLRDALVLGPERTLDQDVAFGVRMLVDMGLRALADHPLADPTTTVQVIDRLHDILRQLIDRDLPDGRRFDDQGAVRLTVPSMDWSDFVSLSFDELRLIGARSPQVSRRLRASLEGLLEISPEDRRAPLERQIRLLDDRIDAEIDTDHDRAFGRAADPIGIGVRAGTDPTAT